MIKLVGFCSEEDAEQILPENNMAIISITHSDHTADLSENWQYRLNVKFDDIDEDEDEDEYILFNDDHAKQILNFLNTLEKTTVESIIVHCHAGISRSAAIAKFISEKYDLFFNHQYQLYNKHVYAVLNKQCLS